MPVLAAIVAVALAAFLNPFAQQAWGIVMMPAVVFATALGGWRGGGAAMGVGMAGWILFLSPPPWSYPLLAVVWLIAHSAAIVAVDLIRQTRYEVREARAI